MKSRKPNAKSTPESYLALQCARIAPWQHDEDDLEFLVQLVRHIRPKHPKVARVDLSGLIAYLRENPECTQRLSQYLKKVLGGKRFSKFLSDAAILQDVDFFFELRKRISAKFLPYLPQKERLDYVLNQVFFLSTDADWIERIPKTQLLELFELLHFNTIYDGNLPETAIDQVTTAMDYIIQRASGRAMESDVIKMVPEFEGRESPFSAFESELQQIEQRLRESPGYAIPTDDLSLRQLSVFHHQCEEFVDRAFANSSKYGISLRVNQHLLRIRQQLQRLGKLLPLLGADDRAQKRCNSIDLALQLIRYDCHKNNIRRFIAESTQLISYEITQHTARTGEHYITETRREYFRMLRAAMGGGVIVGLLCLIKLLLAYVDTSFFGHAFLYSMNYAIGFIAIYMLGFTLATKQPAMTASALVRALEEGEQKQGKLGEKYQAFAILFARVFRSQFIAFVGNVLVAFPVALAANWALTYFTHHNFATAKWSKLALDLSPAHSPALFHAAIAGVFLFLSGIISGSIANRDKHNQVYYRIKEHPILKSTFGKRRTQRLADWYEKRWAGIVSNLWFGVFMGSTASIGLFLGLNLDIRHITFASGNLALAFSGAGYALHRTVWVWGIIGVAAIGFVNFAVSFGLSLLLAFRSRGMAFAELGGIIASIWAHFKHKPMSFFFPTEKRLKSTVEQGYLTRD